MLKMDKSLPRNVKRVFSDIGAMSAEIQKRLNKAIEFQKYQKSLQMKMENRKSAIRKEQIAKIEGKAQEFMGQLSKLASFEEKNQKKIDETLLENEKLKDLIKSIELEMANTVLQVDDDEYEDDFFLRNTPTSSSPSVAGSITDNEDLDFDLLGLKNRSDSSSSSSSSQSNRAGSLF
ncbi:hypothetical protein L3Y34_015629 [Caenorhabditis briggsae]|nr:hypothetical protein L3Y34_015629 [Caenorhabditis briggsae]